MEQPDFNPADYTFHSGTEGPDDFSLTGTEGQPDVFCGFGGQDIGDDLEAGDIFLGGGGNDIVAFNNGTVYGEEGSDLVGTNSGTFYGGGGNDYVLENDGTFYGQEGNDAVENNAGHFDGGDGVDRVFYYNTGTTINVEHVPGG